MAWFPDMGSSFIDQYAAPRPHLRTVGYLSLDHPFTQGNVSAEFAVRLQEFVRQWWESSSALGWGRSLGVHDCEFCNALGMWGEFGVPSDGLLFVAPNMIIHYVLDHQYRPPDEFIAAVLRSPLPDAAEYHVLIKPFREIQDRYQYEQTPAAATHRRWFRAFGELFRRRP